MFYDILDKPRLEILPLFKFFKNRFYLAGGTGLALQLGHRDSIDFDFFAQDNFDTAVFYNELLDLFKNRAVVKTLEEKNTLSLIIGGEIRLSFFRYPYRLLNSCVNEENLQIASIVDIACMKFSAVVSRASEKDFIDLYFIMKNDSLAELLQKTKEKMPDLDQNLVLKSLVYFDDIAPEKLIFKHGFNVELGDVKKFMRDQVKSRK